MYSRLRKFNFVFYRSLGQAIGFSVVFQTFRFYPFFALLPLTDFSTLRKENRFPVVFSWTFVFTLLVEHGCRWVHVYDSGLHCSTSGCLVTGLHKVWRALAGPPASIACGKGGAHSGEQLTSSCFVLKDEFVLESFAFIKYLTIV